MPCLFALAELFSPSLAANNLCPTSALHTTFCEFPMTDACVLNVLLLPGVRVGADVIDFCVFAFASSVIQLPHSCDVLQASNKNTCMFHSEYWFRFLSITNDCQKALLLYTSRDVLTKSVSTISLSKTHNSTAAYICDTSRRGRSIAQKLYLYGAVPLCGT